MRSSIDQVVDVLNGWKDDKRTVAVLLTGSEGSEVKFSGIVVEANPVVLRVFGNDFAVEIRLSVATEFDWQDPKEAPAELAEELLSLYVEALDIRAPLYLCLLFAFKSEEERVDTDSPHQITPVVATGQGAFQEKTNTDVKEEAPMRRFLKIFAAFLLLSVATAEIWLPKAPPIPVVLILCICIAIGATILWTDWKK